ncbi:MAG: DUF3060 domain-containing protein [Actinomycetota bacterium]|nr:DUF3060 domain-containing protein [Actinomycetota bacterium]
MESDGDPEARIRELERPLAEQASASELGTRPYEPAHESAAPASQPWAAPYDHTGGRSAPPAPPPFGSPYYAPPQHVVHKNTRVLWLIPLAIFGAIMVGVLGLAVFFASGDDGTPDYEPVPPPTVAGGSGPVDGPGFDTGEPRVPIPKAADSADTVDAGQTLNIGGVEINRTVFCAGGSVHVSGMSNTVEIRGECGVVTVSGFENVVDVDSAQSLVASGFGNRLTYSTGAPEISNSGSGNTVEPR